MSRAKPDKPITPSHAWQPFTPRGIAAFGNATFTRVFVVQFIMAALVAAAAIWFIRSQWVPVIEDALRALPAETSIRDGRLVTPVAQRTRLAGNTSLEIVIDPGRSAARSGSADMTVVLGPRSVLVCGMLGCAGVQYDTRYVISLTRDGVEAWWGAWRKPIAAAIAAVVLVHLVLLWGVIATLAAPAVRLLAFFADRGLSLAGSWRLAAAAMTPGALLIVLGLVLHGFGAIDPVRLVLFYALHLVCGLIFLATSPSFLPKLDAGAKANPFTAAEAGPPGEKTNPFT